MFPPNLKMQWGKEDILTEMNLAGSWRSVFQVRKTEEDLKQGLQLERERSLPVTIPSCIEIEDSFRLLPSSTAELRQYTTPN